MRVRTLRPGFFETEDLARLHPMCRLLFAGLWCIADREGRLEDRPRLTSSQIFPYEDDLTTEQVNLWLDDLARIQSDGKPFIIRYSACGKRYMQIVGFAKHQSPHPREMKSVIPAPEKPGKPKDKPKDAPKEEPQPENYTAQPVGLSEPSDYRTIGLSEPSVSSEPSGAVVVSTVRRSPNPDGPGLLLLANEGRERAEPASDLATVEDSMRQHSKAAVGNQVAGMALRLYGRSWVESWSQRRTQAGGAKLEHGGAVLRCLARDFRASADEAEKFGPVLVQQERREAEELAEQTARFAMEGENV